jgi:hypothetical protein
MKAAEEGPGPRIRRVHQDLVGWPVLSDRSAVHEQDVVGDVAGESDLVRHDDHRAAVFAELPHDREHLAEVMLFDEVTSALDPELSRAQAKGSAHALSNQTVSSLTTS